jgi:hypothetical protein
MAFPLSVTRRDVSSRTIGPTTSFGSGRRAVAPRRPSARSLAASSSYANGLTR